MARPSPRHRPRAATAAPSSAGRRWARRLTRNLLILIPVVALAWVAVTPGYNLFLRHAGERLTRLTERPAVTRLLGEGPHHLVLTRTDLSAGGIRSLRTTDLHFPLVLLAALFLAVPGLPPGRRFGALGWALLVAVFVHIFSITVWVKSIYATGLGDWSAAHYGPVRQNLYGLARHLLDLPFKLGLPLLLWAVFYLRDLRTALGLEPSNREIR